MKSGSQTFRGPNEEEQGILYRTSSGIGAGCIKLLRSILDFVPLSLIRGRGHDVAKQNLMSGSILSLGCPPFAPCGLSTRSMSRQIFFSLFSGQRLLQEC